MCGRFTLFFKEEDFKEKFNLYDTPTESTRYNIAPTQNIPIIIFNTEIIQNELHMASWGFIHSWLRDPKTAAKPINARCETLLEKPYFRKAFESQRCLIPATGFYEWNKSTKPSTPFKYSFKDNCLFAFAGLWSIWQSPDKQENIMSCTIITTQANSLVSPVHDRMPVVLFKKDYNAWLNPQIDPKTLLPYLKTREIPGLIGCPVNPYVNSPKNDNEKCIEPRTKSISIISISDSESK